MGKGDVVQANIKHEQEDGPFGDHNILLRHMKEMEL
jgi:hypothetical protein